MIKGYTGVANITRSAYPFFTFNISLTYSPAPLAVWLVRSAALPFPMLPLAFYRGIQYQSLNQSGF